MGDPTGDAMKFETRAIHAGQDPEALFGAVSVPIYQNSTYAQEEVGKFKVWDYGRGGNPTRAAFQTALAALEGGARGFAFGSGLGAETTLLLTLQPGDRVVWLRERPWGRLRSCESHGSTTGSPGARLAGGAVAMVDRHPHRGRCA